MSKFRDTELDSISDLESDIELDSQSELEFETE